MTVKRDPTDYKPERENAAPREFLLGGTFRCYQLVDGHKCGEKLQGCTPSKYGYAYCSHCGTVKIFASCGSCNDTGILEKGGTKMACTDERCEAGRRIAEYNYDLAQARAAWKQRMHGNYERIMAKFERGLKR